MRLSAIVLVLVLAGFYCCASRAMFLRMETKKVPIDRLMTNLQARLAQNTNDIEVTYQLARLHSMAYSTNLVKIDGSKKGGQPVFDDPPTDGTVPQEVHPGASPQARRISVQHLTNAILFYERSISLLKKSGSEDQQRWMILPTQLGLAWCLDQAGRREEALQAYRKTLKIAWRMEVTGDFDFKEWIQERWDDVRSGRNPFHGPQRKYLAPGVCYSEEVIGYMLKLLDSVKDANEIAQLKKDQKTLQGMGRAVTPVIVPLERMVSSAELVDETAEVVFDLDGSGLLRKWGWITPKAAWLVFDPDGSGRITSGLQMFGNVTFWIFWRDGYDALSALDDNGDGVLSGRELRGLALWQDRNGNGVSEPGEVRPVADFGII